ncbi:zinc-binding alcohol dehydrogenase family protein [Francisella sp. Scap27]|uniref:quinone oxidoreductase family protein n=1 Tax=Francisella sp. Scap27 TaxID=2589986 RepID=UPI0015BBC6CD|nr:zinc-binding alcohol dehydrogenase family protein [Francisella sp. Scap27]QLE78337.1 zinc-binding alcohol dehydrogenase family protein [Francisella sp. Scap27]
MKTLLVQKNYKDADDIKLDLLDKPKPEIDPVNNCLIKVYSVGVNPSDALATIGYFSHAKVPRVPGRDFAGVVEQGPQHLVGKSIWGSGGAAGIDIDGSLTEYITLPETAFAVAPSDMSLRVAGGQLLPYITAYESLVKRAMVASGETVYIVGALGQVGQASMSICTWKNCKAIALVHGKESIAKAEARGWIAYDTSEPNFADHIIKEHGKADVILNSVGNLVWNEYICSLSEYGRIVNIGAQEGRREAMVNLFKLYRANQAIVGVNTATFSYEYNAKLLDELRVGFDSNKLDQLELSEDIKFSLDTAIEAFKKVLKKSDNKRIVVDVNYE